MATIVTRELLNTAQVGPTPLAETTAEYFFIGGLDLWSLVPGVIEFTRQARITRAGLIELQTQIATALAVTP
jgi:hypothetical protein